MFQHTAARRRLHSFFLLIGQFDAVSTHSRPKAAALAVNRINRKLSVSTHSRPKAAANGKKWAFTI